MLITDQKKRRKKTQIINKTSHLKAIHPKLSTHIFLYVFWCASVHWNYLEKKRLIDYPCPYGEYPFLQHRSVVLAKNCLDGSDLNWFKLKENHCVTKQGHLWYETCFKNSAFKSSGISISGSLCHPLLVEGVLFIGLNPSKTPSL